MSNKGKEFEELIAAVEQAVHDLPSVKVTHDVKLKTNYGGERQIDILIEEERGRFNYKTIIECKNTKGKITVNTVGAFKELLESVGAHQGIIVSASGFQSGAVESAKTANIFLYQLSQIQELEHHLKNYRFNIFEIKHTSKDFTVNFKEKKAINNEITIYMDLFSPVMNRTVTIVEITENFLASRRPGIADALLRTISEYDKIQTISGEINIKIDFPVPLILGNKHEYTEIIGFESILHTEFFTAPTHVKNVSEYKDVLKREVHALVYEVEFEGENFKLLKKEL